MHPATSCGIFQHLHANGENGALDSKRLANGDENVDICLGFFTLKKFP